MKKLAVNYHMKDWKEETVFETAGGGKLTRVQAEFAYEGPLQGKAVSGCLLHYGLDQHGLYDGWELFEGSFEGKAATVVFRIDGDFHPDGVNARVESVAGTGTGALAGVKLAYSVVFKGHGPYPVELEVGD